MHEAVSGRLTRPETIHLTLVFIGDLARDRIPGLIAKLARITAPAFKIELDHAACWQHNKIAYLAPSRSPEQLLGLVGVLESSLEQLAIAFDRRPFKPHVTLVRKADCRNENPASGRVFDAPEWGAMEPIMWSAEECVLVESVATPAGVRYDVLGRFRLL